MRKALGVPVQLSLMLVASTVAAQGWTPQVSGTANLLEEVWFTDAQNGWVVGDVGTSLVTADGGATWSAVVLTGQDLGDVTFAGANVGLIVGDNGTIFHTTNAGAAWTPRASGTGENLAAAAFGGGNVAYAAGRNGVITRSTDQGASWTLVETGADRYRDMDARGARAWIVGDGGVIRATTDGGVTWFNQNSGTGSDLGGVFFLTESEGWAAGQNSTVIHTGDGGATWTPRSTGLVVGVDAVFFVSSTRGWTVGNGGAVFQTTNGGLLWVPEASGTANELNDVFFVGAARGWVVGDLGTVLVRDDPTDVADPLRESALSALTATPNPFRSALRIDYSLERAGSPVSVRVYDSRGRLVRDLGHAGLAAGSHEVHWSGTDDRGAKVGSGVYFVRVESEEWAETTKVTRLR